MRASVDGSFPASPISITADQIQMARDRMTARNPDGCLNATLTASALGEHTNLKSALLDRWERIVQQRKLSARSGLRVLRVARTLADLHNRDCIDSADLAESLCFRSFDLTSAEP